MAHNYLYLELQACEVFGLDPDVYFKKDRDMRKAMTGFVYGRTLVTALEAYESREEAKRK